MLKFFSDFKIMRFRLNLLSRENRSVSERPTIRTCLRFFVKKGLFAQTDVQIEVFFQLLNIMGKPILHSVEDAMGLLMTTELDAVLIEDVLVQKPSSPEKDV